MIKVIQKDNKEPYQGRECGMKYVEKWMEKCKAWRKEHHSCNVEITAHAVPRGDGLKKRRLRPESIKFLIKLFYGLVVVVSSLVFFLILYWALRLDSSITNIITNTYSTPLYFWPYVILTLGTIILFGINVALFIYHWKKFGPPKLKMEAGGGAGTIFSVAASACPMCGSTLLSAIGIAGGLATLPLGGLELKALSFGLLALPIWLIRKNLKKLEADCESGVCPLPKGASFKEADRPWLVVLFVLVIALSLISWNWLKSEPIIVKVLAQNNIPYLSDNVISDFVEKVTAQVLPEKGFQSKIVLGDSVIKLVQNGVIDREKFLAVYENRGGLPNELKNVLDTVSTKPILLTRENANYYINLMWPLGLANYMSSNKKSPINGKSLFRFASTGGWDLGKEEKGGAYFNKFKIVELTPEQEALVTKIAQNTYRPCCNNSTFFQDCNHGSALLGLLQLGASQGLTENELYREALMFNSFWFPYNYIQTALYFKVVRGIDWNEVDPKVVMGKDFSTASGWYANVDAEVKRLGLVPQKDSGTGCGV